MCTGDGHAGGGGQEVCRPAGKEVDLGYQAAEKGEQAGKKSCPIFWDEEAVCSGSGSDPTLLCFLMIVLLF